MSIRADVSIGPHGSKANAFNIAVVLNVSVPGVERSVAEALVAAAHEVCPYSNATRGNVDVSLQIA